MSDVTSLSLDAVRFVGEGLVRPECVLATRSGDLYASDWRGGVAHLRPDGTQALYAGRSSDLADGPRPNGIALEPDGSFLLAQLGAEQGGVYRLTRQGQLSPVLLRADGADLPPTNFVARDAAGRLWVTVSTRKVPRALDYRSDASSGFVVLDDGRGPRIVADGLGYTNECGVDPSGNWLYVVETYARLLSRFPLHQDGRLGPKQVVARFGAGQFPDGMAFARDGSVWIAGVVSNQLLRVDPDGTVTTMLEDCDPGHLSWVEDALAAGGLERRHLDTPGGSRLGSISSLAFGGPDLRTGFLGCLLGDAVAAVRLPVAGVPPVHWHW